jgi:SAM-dependent methyltransferase
MSSKIHIDPVWEKKYADGHQTLYPWDLVVSFVFRYRPKEKKIGETNLLELGFGTGSNLWFAAREGFIVGGVEGSPSAVEKAKERFILEKLNGDLRLGDFTQLPFEDNAFDIALDRGSLVCVGKSLQKTAIKEVHRCLRKGGKFLLNGYTDDHSSRNAGIEGDDGLISNITQGTLTGVGSLAFLSRSDINNFFADGWRLIKVERKEVIDMLNPSASIHSEWIVIAEKL